MKKRNEHLVKLRRKNEKEKLEDTPMSDSEEEEIDQFMFEVEQAQKAEMYAAKRENREGRDIEIYQTLGWRYIYS